MFSRTITRTRVTTLSRLLPVLFFAALTAVTARIAIPLPFTPVPVTLQVLSVLLAGLVLGARGGTLSQIAYLGSIAIGLPLTASGVAGPAAFAGPTAGYLIAFAPAAFVTGLLVERFGTRFVASLVAALAGVAVIYAGGTAWLAVWLGGNVAKAWQLGVAPFVLIDVIKAFIAVAVANGGRRVIKF